MALIRTADGTNFKSVFAAANGGDTIVLSGNIGTFLMADRSFSTRLTINATNANFTDTLTIKNISGLTMTGGAFGSTTTAMRAGRAVAVYGGSNISISKGIYVGNGAGMGLTFAGTTSASATANQFSGLGLGMGLTAVTNTRLTSNIFRKMTKDGINIAGSYRITATANKCSLGIPAPGVHPDCIQLWSIAGTPVQSDILLNNNNVQGPTQGLTSFTPANGGGLRITIKDNYIETSFPQGIACYECSDSVFTGNTLKTLAGSLYQTQMNIVGGTNNIISGNSIAARAVIAPKSADSAQPGSDTSVDPLPDFSDPSQFFDPLPSFVTDDLALINADGFDDGTVSGDPTEIADALDMAERSSMFALNTTNVPEPSVWLQFIAGFGLVGAMLRRPTRTIATAN